MSAPDLRLGDCLDVLRSLPDASVDAVVTDPPYGLSFMGKRWDYDVPSVEIWAECLRVLKPGGHLLAFAGTRTQHRMAVRIEDAGFEIRDMIAWVYGSGFPKSLDVSKAVDRMDASEEQERRRLRFTAWVRSTGATSRQIDEATGTNMGGHYTTAASQPAIMTREHLEACRHLLGDVPEWVEREADIRSVESRNMAEREVVGRHGSTAPGCNMRVGMTGCERDEIGAITAPATDAARQWAGWGTALKPAMEPITVARKPLVGTVAENVLTHGTGALNVDGCRIGTEGGGTHCSNRDENGKCRGHQNAGRSTSGETFHGPETDVTGRWPANIIHDGSEEVVGLFPESVGNSNKNLFAKETSNKVYGRFAERGTGGMWRNDAGSAARFFYCAKASKRDRDEGLDGFAIRSAGEVTGGREDGSAGLQSPRAGAGRTNGARNHHPTVKPTDLMRYLCRLVTPPGGVVLDPFMGSGSTGKAAVLEGFRFIGIEREAEYVEIARARIKAVTPAIAEPVKDHERNDTAQLSLLLEDWPQSTHEDEP